MTALPELPGPPGLPADAPRLLVRGPDCLPAVVPHLLGFHPDDSVVVLGLEPGTHRVRVTVRIDLPPEDDDGAGWSALVPAFARVGATEALLVVYPPSAADPWRSGRAATLPRRDVVGAAAEALADVGVRALDAVCVVGDRIRSYWCCDEACCPPEGRVVPPDELVRIQAEFVGSGSAPLSSRRSLEKLLDPRPHDDPFLLEVAEEVAARAGDVATCGADDVDSFLVGLVIHASGSDQPNLLATLVGMATSLSSWVRPRDLLMRALSVDCDPALVRSARAVLVEAVRCARGPGVAPVASLLAVCGWLAGDGALARVALDRAHRADPGYSLATLLTAALDGGMPPWAWTAMMAEVTVDRILQTGDGPPRSASPGPFPWERDDELDGCDDAERPAVRDGHDADHGDRCADPSCASCECARGTDVDDPPGGAVRHR